MGLGYQCEVNRRYGGHGGHETEWEFSSKANTSRVRKLHALDHSLLAAFHFYYEERDTSDGFCVVRNDPANAWLSDLNSLVHLLVDYLTAWPNPEVELSLLIKIHRFCPKHALALRREGFDNLRHHRETGERQPSPIFDRTRRVFETVF